MDNSADPAAEDRFLIEAFHVPGTYVNDMDGTRMVGQIYVERIRLPPVDGSKRPKLVLLHGGGLTGCSFGTTPDGRRGWREHFAARGLDVFVVDQATRGRAGHHVERQPIGPSRTVEWVQAQYTACAEFKAWPAAHKHTQWPGTGRHGDRIFDRFFAAAVPYFTSNAITEDLAVAGVGKLLDQIGPATILTHSQGGPVGWRLADARPALVESVVAVEPSGPPGTGGCPVTDSAYGGTPILFTYGVSEGRLAYSEEPTCRGHDPGDTQACPPPRLVNLAGKHVLVVTGEASYHSQYDHLTVSFLQQAGVVAEHLKLESHGLSGNAHMMMCELNNLAIADEILSWLVDREIGMRPRT